MPKQRPHIPFNRDVPLAPGFRALLTSWQRAQRAQNKSPRTIETYLDALLRFGEWLVETGVPQDVAKIERAHIEAFISQQLERYAPATANNRYRALQQFFKWLVEDEEIRRSPMEHMKPPRVPTAPPPVMADEQVRAILNACRGADFRARRDTAIIRLLLDTGLRRTEVARLQLNDIDLDRGTAMVRAGKGGDGAMVAFGHKAAAALDRYLRKRAEHPFTRLDALWLGHAGAMTPSGIYQVARERAEAAGVPGVYPHLFRHKFASDWLEQGGQEGDLMELGRWKTRRMIDTTYGRAERNRRAREAHKRLSPGDRI